MSGFDDHVAIFGEWIPPSPSPPAFVSSLLADDVGGWSSHMEHSNESQSRNFIFEPQGHVTWCSSDGKDGARAGAATDQTVKPNAPSDQKTSSRGGLMERMVARAGFNAPRLNTDGIRPPVLSLNQEVRSPYLTIPAGLSPSVLLYSPVMIYNSLVYPSPTTGLLPFASGDESRNVMLTTEAADKRKETAFGSNNSSSFSYNPIMETGRVNPSSQIEVSVHPNNSLQPHSMEATQNEWIRHETSDFPMLSTEEDVRRSDIKPEVYPAPTTGLLPFASDDESKSVMLTAGAAANRKETAFGSNNSSSFSSNPIMQTGIVNPSSQIEVSVHPNNSLQPHSMEATQNEWIRHETSDYPMLPTEEDVRGSDIKPEVKTFNVVGGSTEHYPSLDEKQYEETKQRGGEDSKDDDASVEDGYNWRKYGQNQVKGSKYPRSYYKCTHPNCAIKKKITRHHEGHVMEIKYNGAHNHPKPLPNRISSLGSSNSFIDMQLDNVDPSGTGVNVEMALTTMRHHEGVMEIKYNGAYNHPKPLPNRISALGSSNSFSDMQLDNVDPSGTGVNVEMALTTMRHHEGVMEIKYNGAYNHPKPLPNRISALGSSNSFSDLQLDNVDPSGTGANSELALTTIQQGPMSGGLEWKNDNLEATSLAALHSEYCSGSTTLQSNGAQLGSADAVDVSSTFPRDEDDRGTHGSVSLGYDCGGDETESKIRKIEPYATDTSGTSKPIREPRVVVQTISDVDILDDGYRWRKYGQKVVKGNPNPRSYYKCTSPGCNVRKHVERAPFDMKSVITTYEGKHNHDVPAARNSSQVSSGASRSPSNLITTDAQSHVSKPEPTQLQNTSKRYGGAPSLGSFVGTDQQQGLTGLAMSGFNSDQHQFSVPVHPYIRCPQPVNDAGFVIPEGEPMPDPSLNYFNGSSTYQQLMNGLPPGPQM